MEVLPLLDNIWSNENVSHILHYLEFRIFYIGRQVQRMNQIKAYSDLFFKKLHMVYVHINNMVNKVLYMDYLM